MAARRNVNAPIRLQNYGDVTQLYEITGVCNWRYGAKSSSPTDLEAPKYLFPASAELGTMYN